MRIGPKHGTNLDWDINRCLPIALRITWLSLLAGFFCSLDLQADGPRWLRSQSRGDQITVESLEPGAADSFLEAAVRTRTKLSTALALGDSFKSRTRHLIRIELAPEASNAPVPLPTLSARRDEKGLLLQTTVRGVAPGKPVPENFIRVFTMALVLERAVQSGKIEQEVDHFPGLPLWLVEGLTQSLQENNQEALAMIARRALLMRKAPKLEEVLSWRELSEDPLQRSWQQAFCWLTWRAAVSDPYRRSRFLEWLDHLVQTSTAEAEPYWNASREELEWRTLLDKMSNKEADVVFTWDETATRFARLQTASVPGKKESDLRLARLDQLDNFIERPELVQTVDRVSRDLLSLELRAHFAWRPVLAEFRLALLEIVPAIRGATMTATPTPIPTPGTGRGATNPPIDRTRAALDSYRSGMGRAQASLELLLQSREQVADYLNWFEVTQSLQGSSSRFTDYSRLQEEMEKVEVRPGDPFRSEMIRVESGR